MLIKNPGISDMFVSGGTISQPYPAQEETAEPGAEGGDDSPRRSKMTLDERTRFICKHGLAEYKRLPE